MKRRDGRWTHFDWVDDQKNYIRGDTVVDGRLYTSSGSLSGSDKRLKDNIQILSQDEKDKILKLEPSSYILKSESDKKRHYGLIAQDVENVYPNIVENSPNGMKSLNYSELIPITIANIKDIKKSIPNNKQICIEDVCVTKNDLLKLKLI
jgi:hypothetical protein